MVSRLFGIFNRMRSADDCEEVRNMSSDYIDDDLGSKAAKVSSHILNCGPCKSFINTLRATVSLLRSTSREEPPPNFRERLRERLKQEQGK